MMNWKRMALTAGIWTMIAAGMSGAANFDYMKSVDEVAEDPLTAYQTVYLGMPRADFTGNFSILKDWTYTGDGASYQEKAERTTTDGSVTVTEGLAILTASTEPTGKVLAFDNYFLTKDKNTAKAMYSRLVSTVYANMESFPSEQSGDKVVWIHNDITVVVSFTGKTNVKGNYVVLLRRFNNHVLSE